MALAVTLATIVVALYRYPLTPSRGKHSNVVLLLDGTNAYLRVPDSPSLRALTNTLTLEAWIRPFRLPDRNGGVNCVIRRDIAPGSQDFFIRLRRTNDGTLIEFAVGTNSLRTAYSLDLGRWYHLAGVCDSTGLALFVNGFVVGSLACDTGRVVHVADLFIGRGDPTFSRGEFFCGEIDEVRIWSIARSQDAIRSAMRQSVQNESPGLVASWNFDSRTARDGSPSENHGVLEEHALLIESGFPQPWCFY